MSRLARKSGYASTTVTQAIALAGVSRTTFYEHFRDRETCFLAVLEPLADDLLAALHQDVARGRPQDAARAAIGAFVGFAASRPFDARLLMSDSLRAGPRLRDARDGWVDAAARIVEETERAAAPGAVVADLPANLICGVTWRLLAQRLGRAGDGLGELAADLLDWIAAYERPLADCRWDELATLSPAARSPYLSPSPLRAPPALRAVGPRAPEGALADDNWMRIVFATAELVRREGYPATTVTEIARVADVDPSTFYRLFDGKQQALVAAGDLLFRRSVAAAAGAFVTGETWPQRVWEGARALTQSVAESPSLAYVWLTETGGEGADARDRLDDLSLAFSIFLQEGEACLPEGRSRSKAAPSEGTGRAIAAAVFELGYRDSRAVAGPPHSALLGHVVVVSLAPFLGVERAGEFVCGKASAAEMQPGLAA